MTMPKLRLPEGEDLGLDWDKWADGRAFRLKRKRDFPADLNPELARDAARYAAEKRGKVVRTITDRWFPKKYIWVQFADGEVEIGEPCPCGSRRLLRLHQHFARCPECDRQLILTMPEDDGSKKEPRPVRVLRNLTDIHLIRRGRSGDNEVYRGYGTQAGIPVFLFVEFRAEPEESLDAEEVFTRAVSVQVVPFNEVEDLFDASSVSNEDDWDLVLQPSPSA